MISFLMIAGGFVLLVYGANRLVDGASSLARHYHVPNIVIGLTIIAFGTSAPELVVNVVAASGGETDLVIGNVLGSNIMNVAIILGIASLIAPLTVMSNTTWVEVPLSFLAALLLVVMGNDIILDITSVNVISRSDGIVLLAFFLIFMVYSLHMMKSDVQENHQEEQKYTLKRALLFIFLGLILAVVGGRLIVTGATSIARILGVSDRIIALTIVALGTSLPELATSVVAVRKGKVDLAIGNIVGSNIFNIFFILGISAVIFPVEIPPGGMADMGVNILASLLLFVFIFTGKGRRLVAWEGMLFLGLYAGYLAYLLL